MMREPECTPGDTPLPSDKNACWWDIDLCNWNDGKGPELLLSIPPWFELNDGTVYDGDGVLTVPLQDVLEEYLVQLLPSKDGSYLSADGGEGAPAFVAWLRDYADRMAAVLAQEEA
jgi:hypothetical protein